MPNLKEIIAGYQKLGLSFFAVPYKSKQSIIEWKQYQSRKPSTTEINTWINGHNTNIAVVCGKISGNLVVLDCDSQDKFTELSSIICQSMGIDDIKDFTLISKTSKGFHIWLRTKNPLKSMKFPNLDIKAEGGYIIAPPSVHPSGAIYEFINKLPIVKVDNLMLIGVDIEQKPDEPVNQPGWVTELLQGVPSGGGLKNGRNNAAISLAGYFRNLMPIDITQTLLLDWNKKNDPPLENNVLLKTIQSAYKQMAHPPSLASHPPVPPPFTHVNYSPHNASRDTQRDKSVTKSVTLIRRDLAKEIKEWVSGTTAWFSYEELDREVVTKSLQERDNRRQIIKRLKESGVLEAHPRDNKLYRFINSNVRLIDFKSAGNSVPLAVKYPFEIERYFDTFPGNIICIAGTPDAGKTAFLLNFVRLNMDSFSIFYQSSEMGEAELASRLSNFEGIALEDWTFTAEERSSNFADIIRPDCVNIIDYMELCGDFYMVADYMRQIYEKLKTGIALIALQKDPKSEQGRGGTFSLEKPRLYLNMDPGKVTIRKAKNWTDPTYNPNKLQLGFRLVGGCNFIVDSDWHKEDEF